MEKFKNDLRKLLGDKTEFSTMITIEPKDVLEKHSHEDANKLKEYLTNKGFQIEERHFHTNIMGVEAVKDNLAIHFYYSEDEKLAAQERIKKLQHELEQEQRKLAHG